MQGYGAGGTVNLELQKPPWTWLSTEAFAMGRDPVSRAKRAKYKPPAMRVRGVCYTKKSPFRYNFGCSSLNYNERKGDFNGQ